MNVEVMDMAYHPVTINLPDNVYKQIRQAAEKKQRSVNEVLVEAVTAVAPTMDLPASRLRSELAHMTYLNDAALWQIARATLSPEQRERLELLHRQQQQSSLTDEEVAEVAELEQLYRDTLLIRAQAAILLKQRNYDIADPSQFQPLE